MGEAAASDAAAARQSGCSFGLASAPEHLSDMRTDHRSGSVCLNNFPRTISEALWVHNSAEFSNASDGACDVLLEPVGNSGRTKDFHSMRPWPVLAGWHGRLHPAFDPLGWSGDALRCTATSWTSYLIPVVRQAFGASLQKTARTADAHP